MVIGGIEVSWISICVLEEYFELSIHILVDANDFDIGDSNKMALKLSSS